MALVDGTPLLNEFDCPLFSLARTILSVDSSNILAAVSFVHECDEACNFVERNVQLTQEREETEMSRLFLNITGVICCSVITFSVYNKYHPTIQVNCMRNI